jgi:hypothetical protein
MISWNVLEIIAAIFMVIIAYWVAHDIVKAEDQKRKKLIITWSCIFVVGVCLFVSVRLNQGIIMARFFPGVYYPGSLSTENETNIEIFPKTY